MANYTVLFGANLEAVSPEEAAKKLKEQMETHTGTVKRFEVYDTASGVRMDVKIPDPEPTP